jgi:hypothetical protein
MLMCARGGSGIGSVNGVVSFEVTSSISADPLRLFETPLLSVTIGNSYVP